MQITGAAAAGDEDASRARAATKRVFTVPV
jgi:hypothetical protein